MQSRYIRKTLACNTVSSLSVDVGDERELVSRCKYVVRNVKFTASSHHSLALTCDKLTDPLFTF